MVKELAGQRTEAHVEGLFSAIAPKYDLLNSLMSFGRHRAWRRLAVLQSGLGPGGCALDVCCGTGDFALELARRTGPAGRVVGVDFSLPMIELARRKAERKRLGWMEFVQANAAGLPFEDGQFDCVTVGFGLRNVADLPAALAEMVRVTRSGGRVVSLEIFGRLPSVLSLPWKLYFGTLVPCAAAALRAKREAYEYLPWSVERFLSPDQYSEQFEACGLRDVRRYDLAVGAVCVHVGVKPGEAAI